MRPREYHQEQGGETARMHNEGIFGRKWDVMTFSYTWKKEKETRLFAGAIS
jgi:hypothetical protein